MGFLVVLLLMAAVAPEARPQGVWPTVRWQAWITGGLEAPVDLQSPRDGSGRLFVVEQRGRIRLIRDGALVTVPMLDIVSKVLYGGEMGLLGLAFPPGFRQKQYFYVNYIDRQRRTIVARYRMQGDRSDAAGEEILLTIPQPFDNHNGGQLAFSPRDGQLYIGMGDGGSAGDPQKHAQNPNSQLGKMLRMDVENGAATAQIWALGLRNPWRFSFDRETGDLYVGDVGQDTREEIDFQPAGAEAGLNYGWNLVEGTHCYDDRDCASRTGLVRPVFDYGRGDGISVTGGFVYRGAAFPFLRGTYLFGDYGSGQVFGLRRNGSAWESSKLVSTGLPISSFGEDEAGELYLVSHNGRILRLASDAPAAAVNAVVSGASFLPGLAPGGLATAFLSPLAGVSALVTAERYPLPMTLSGVSVRVNGTAAPLHAVANGGGGAQVNFQVPWTTAAGEATVAVNGAEGKARVAAVAPAVFTMDGRLAAAQLGRDNSLITAANAAATGDVIVVFVTGLGAVSNAPVLGAAAGGAPLSVVLGNVEVLIGGRAAPVQFAGLTPGFAGLYQVNAVVPGEVPAGEAELVVRVGEASSAGVRLPIRSRN